MRRLRFSPILIAKAFAPDVIAIPFSDQRAPVRKYSVTVSMVHWDWHISIYTAIMSSPLAVGWYR